MYPDKKSFQKEKDIVRELSISDGKMPPNALDFEKLVIGTLLIDSRSIDRVIKRFGENADVFYDPRHQTIFSAIMDLQSKNYPVDMMSVIQELKRTEKLNLGGGDHYIIDMTMKISSSANLDYHLMIVLQKHLARKMIASCFHTIDMLYRETTDALEEISNHVTKINEVEEIIARQQETATSLELHKKLIEQQINKIIPGIKSKHSSLNKRMNGYRNGTSTIIAARPAMGKTTFVLDDVFDMAKRGEPVAFFSLEMSADELHQKLVSNETEIPGNALRDRLLGDMEMQRIYAVNTFDKLPFYIEDNATELNQILAKCRILKKEKDVKIIVIDYLQLIDYSSKNKNREQEISFISRKIKLLAKELQIPIVTLSQLSRNVEQRPGKRPQLSDLRESGAIEQDADMVIFIYRPEYYKIATWDRDWDGENELPTKNEVEIICAKFRGGGVFDERLKFRGDYSKFYDVNFDLSGYTNPVPTASLSQAFPNENKIEEDDDFKF